ncbi:MAG: RluA family pseudouridine synthase [Elusimicrobiota bacterium]|nr:MAG: RluA family pseudouridine synthase [Elusimicrobiota bacterium]
MTTAAPAEWIDVPFRVLKEHEGRRLDAYLAERLGKKYSRAAVQKLIDDGLVTRPGKPVKAAARVAAGETVMIRYRRQQEPPVPHETMPVLYQDERLVVISKPGGTLSHPTDKVLHNTVTHLLSKQLGRKVYLAHRLDRETSGAMVLALDADAARSLYEQFVGRGVRKEYLAVVFGSVAWEEKVVDAPLGAEGKAIRVRRAVGGEGAQSAVTAFRRLATDGRLSLVSCSPRTGRLHQIRAHLAHVGHPLVGDKLYVGEGEAYMKAVRKEVSRADLDALGADRQLLHAWKLSLTHPDDGRALSFEAPVPDDFPLRPPR